MSILGIDEITYGAADLDTCRRFFADWGLKLVQDADRRLVFESLNGCRVLVADPAHVSLPAPIEAGPTLSAHLLALAVAERARTPLLPNVPTLTERGIKGVEVNAWYGVFAAAATPGATIAAFNEAVNEAVRQPDARKRLSDAGIELRGGTPQELALLMREDEQRYARIARALKISAD